MKQLNKFIRLPIQEKFLFFQSLYYLTVFRFRLITTSPQALFTIVSKQSITVQSSGSTCLSSQRIARIISRASSLIPYSTCLSVALAGNVLFARNGHKTNLHIGVSKDEEQQLEAHAWLTLDGKVILLGNLPDILRFQELPVVSEEDK